MGLNFRERTTSNNASASVQGRGRGRTPQRKRATAATTRSLGRVDPPTAGRDQRLLASVLRRPARHRGLAAPIRSSRSHGFGCWASSLLHGQRRPARSLVQQRRRDERIPGSRGRSPDETRRSQEEASAMPLWRYLLQGQATALLQQRLHNCSSPSPGEGPCSPSPDAEMECRSKRPRRLVSRR
jgi:hypothetical protein